MFESGVDAGLQVPVSALLPRSVLAVSETPRDHCARIAARSGAVSIVIIGLSQRPLSPPMRLGKPFMTWIPMCVAAILVRFGFLELGWKSGALDRNERRWKEIRVENGVKSRTYAPFLPVSQSRKQPTSIYRPRRAPLFT